MSRIFSTFACITFTLLLKVVHAEILITKLDDINISTSSNLARDLVMTERLCVASNPVGPYGLAVLGSGNNGEFVIENGPYSIRFEVSFRDRVARGGFREVNPGTPLTGLLTRQLRNGNRCPGNASRLRITIPRDVLNSATAGVYQGFLQLTVIPE